MRLIDANETIREIVRNSLSESSAAIEATAKAIHCIENMPFIERKKGTWKREISHYNGAYHLYCSNCGECCGITIDKLNKEWNFCPNCGADMKREE